MKRFSTKVLLFTALIVIALSIVLATISLFPRSSGGNQPYVLVNNTFQLSPNETYKQGLGSFHGGENISISVQCPTTFQKKFSIVFPTRPDYLIIDSGSDFSILTQSNITYSFTAGANYYEAVFVSDSLNVGTVHFQASVQEPNVIFPYSWLNEPSKIAFLLSLGLAMLALLEIVLSSDTFKSKKLSLPSLSKKNRQYLFIMLLLSLMIWIFLVAVNSNPLAAFENWYTDIARDSYASSLFLKDGFSIFNQPLGKLSSLDNSYYKFVTWPEMPHLYPLGSVLLFLPFGVLLQNGFDSSLIFKIEIAIFLVFATVCLYFFLKDFFQKDMALLLKLVGFYIIYVSLIIYAADGMFDSVAFLFSLFALYMFLTKRYDYFFLLVAVSIFFKYQAGIFLFPLIILGLIKLFQANTLTSLLRNKAVIAGVIFGFVSLFTAYLSAPYFLATGPQLIMNSINAFSRNTQISWELQSFLILLTLTVTIAYAAFMLNKNSLLSLSALFLLLPSFMLPYFQNWYLPFIFIYALIPQQKKELEVTSVWLIFMIFMLSLSGVAFNPLQILTVLGHL
ncbi:MAG: hypothetical protein ABSA75_08390 [Candidatus Bathyarchaeia archaeon]